VRPRPPLNFLVEGRYGGTEPRDVAEAAAIRGRARFGNAPEPDARLLRNQVPKSWCEESQERSQ